MEPVLIYTDTQRIEEEINRLDDSVIFFQALYDAFLSIDVTPTLSELAGLLQQINNRPENTAKIVEHFVGEKYLDKAGEPVFNGVPIQRSKLREMLELPNMASVITALNGRHSFSNGGYRIELMTLAANVITKNANADDLITVEFTSYTKNDRSAQFVTQVNAVIAALNNWRTSYMNDLGYSQPFRHEERPIPGIMVRNNTFVPDVNFIRSREALYS